MPARVTLTLLTIAMVIALAWLSCTAADAMAPAPVTVLRTSTARHESAANGTADSRTGATTPLQRTEMEALEIARGVVRIVDEDGLPVAAAEVAFDNSPELLYQDAILPFDAEERLAAAPRCRSDQDGLVAIPGGRAAAFVIARAGERYGHGTLSFDCPHLGLPVLRIAPDRNLRIRVRGPRGESRAGVPVEVAWQEGEGRTDSGVRRHRLPRSDASGSVMLWHAQLLECWSGAEPAVEIRALVQGAQTQPVRVVLAEAPAEVAVACPPHGGIRLRTWLSSGVPAPETTACNAVGVSVIVDGDYRSCESLLMAAPPGECLLFPVALGRCWWLGIDRFVGKECEGPGWDGHEVCVDLLAEASSVLVSILLLQPDGRPCAGRTITVSFACRDWSLVTDATGRLRVACTCSDEEQWLEVVDRDTRACRDIALPPIAPGGAPCLDLGAVTLVSMVRLQQSPVLAVGRVVDGRTGCPVRAAVTVTDATGGSEVGCTRSDMAGAFTVHGDAPGQLRIAVDSYGYQSATVMHTAGSGCVLIALEPRVHLQVTVLVDDTVSVENLTVLLREQGDDRPIRTVRRPGQVLCVFDPGDDETLAVEVYGGASIRLAHVPKQAWSTVGSSMETTIDLRSALDQMSVCIRTADQGFECCRLYLRESRASKWTSGQDVARALFAVPRGTALELIAVPRWSRFVRTWLRPGDNTIVLPDPATLRIAVVGAPADWQIEVFAILLARREPALDELRRRPDLRWPATIAEARELTRKQRCDAAMIVGGATLLELPDCGSYLILPVRRGEGTALPLLDAALAVEVAVPGATLAATIHVDSGRERAVPR